MLRRDILNERLTSEQKLWKRTTEQTTESGQQIEVGFFRPEDAAGIVELVRAVYGEGYPIKVFYDEKALTDANAQGEYYSIVARTQSGKIVGVEHLFPSAPYKSLYETGAGMVLKDYRQFGINKRMMKFIYDEWVSDQGNIQETFGEAVCNHPHMQRVVSQMRHVETALELALMPAEAYNKEQSASWPRGCSPRFQVLQAETACGVPASCVRERVAMDLFTA